MKFKVGETISPIHKNMYNKDIRRLILRADNNTYSLMVLDDSQMEAHHIYSGYTYDLDFKHSSAIEIDYAVGGEANDILKDLCSK